MTQDAEWAVAMIRALDDQTLAVLAERLAPYLPQQDSEGARDRWLSARGAASHLGISVHALHKLSAARQIPFEQDGPGCKLWFRRSELDRWRQRGGPSPPRTASTPLPHRSRAAS